MELSNIASIIPELFLACAGMFLLLYGVFRGDTAYRAVSWLTVVTFVIVASLVFLGEGRNTLFGGQFVADGFARFMVDNEGAIVASFAECPVIDANNAWLFNGWYF